MVAVVVGAIRPGELQGIYAMRCQFYLRKRPQKEELCLRDGLRVTQVLTILVSFCLPLGSWSWRSSSYTRYSVVMCRDSLCETGKDGQRCQIVKFSVEAINTQCSIWVYWVNWVLLGLLSLLEGRRGRVTRLQWCAIHSALACSEFSPEDVYSLSAASGFYSEHPVDSIQYAESIE